MKNYGLLLWILLLSINIIHSQNQPAASTGQHSVRASTDEGSKQLIVETWPNTPLSPGLQALMSDENNYRIYRISFDNPSAPISTVLNFDDLFAGGPIGCNGTTGVCLINLKNSLDPGNYVIEIPGLRRFTNGSSDSVQVFFALKAPKPIPVPGISTTTASIVSSIDGRRNKVRLQSKSPITANPSLQVLDTTLAISDDDTRVVQSSTPIQAQVEDKNNPGKPASGQSTEKEFTLLLDNGLAKAQTHNLSIKDGVFDAGNNKVKTEGSVEIPGLPKAPDALNFELKLSSESANHQKPFFNLATKYDAQDLLPIGNCFLSVSNFPCYWQPQISVDVGLGDTKSKNSIIIDLPLRSLIHHDKICLNHDGEPSIRSQKFKSCTDPSNKVFQGLNPGETAIPAYYAWANTPLYKGDIFLFVGPKFESDRRFARINTLGSIRLDFKIHRLLASIGNRRGLLTGGAPYGLTKQQLSQVEIKSGYSLIPSIGIDFGRKVTAEVLEKNNLRQVIPRHSIFRGYAGFKSTFEWELFTLPMSFSIDEKLSYLADQETIGSIIGNRINIRRIKGFHNRGVASWDIFLNQVRRYSFNITYENGRSAPNFEYLNKVSAGLRIVY